MKLPWPLAVVAFGLMVAVPTVQAEFWEGVNDGLNRRLDNRKPRPEKFYIEPGVYDAKVTSDGANAYAIFNGGPRIRTRLCSHRVGVDDAVLNIESVGGFNIGTITFSDGTECQVSRIE